MKIEVKKLPKSRVEIEVTLEKSEIKPYYDRTLSDLSRTVEMKGFRPGKVPRETVEKTLGRPKILVEAAERSVEELYPKIVVEKNLEIIGRPEIEIKKADEDEFFWRAKASVLPEIKLADYKDIAKSEEKKKVSVEKKEIDDSIDYLQKSRAEIKDADRPAELGDLVEVDFEGRVAGGKLEGSQSKNHPAVLGEGKLIPGFEDELAGLKVGEEKDFSVQAPADYWEQNLRGKKIDFHVKVIKVRERKLLDLNDEFAKKLGHFENLENLKSSVNEGLLVEKQEKEKERRRAAIVEKVAVSSSMDLPELLVDEEIKKMVHELSHTVERNGLKLEDYLAHVKKSADDLHKEFRQEAEKRVRVALVMREVARCEQVKISDEELDSKTQEILRTVPPEDQKKIDIADLKVYANGILRNQKVFEILESY